MLSTKEPGRTHAANVSVAGISGISSKEAKELLKEARNREKRKSDAEKRRSNKKRQRKSTQNLLKYDSMDADGICRIEPGVYSAGIKAENINYLALVEEKQAAAFESWCDFLNQLGDDVAMEVFIHTKLPDEDDVKGFLTHPMLGTPSDDIRAEFNGLVLSAARKNVLFESPDLLYIFTVKAESADDAAPILNGLQTSCMNYCSRLGRDCHKMDGKERLEAIAGALRPDDIFLFDYQALGRSQTTKDAVAPGYANLLKSGLSAPSMMAIDDKYFKFWMMTWVPSRMRDGFLPELFSIGMNAFWGLHVFQYGREEAVKMINDKLKSFGMEKEGVRKKARRNFEDPEIAQRDELKDAVAELKSVKSDIEDDNQNYFEFSLFGAIYGSTREEVLEQELKLKRVASKYSYRLSPASARPIEALNSCLPIGKPQIRAKATGTTAELGALMPLSGNSLSSDRENMFYGRDSVTGAPIFVSRRYGLDDPHGIVLGQTGQGKSMGTKSEVEQVRLFAEEDWYRLGRKTKQVLISDPENETEDWIKGTGGAFVDLGEGSGTILNPCDIYISENTPEWYNPISNKASFFKGLINQIAELPPETSAFLNAELTPILKDMYHPTEYPDWTGTMPVLKDLVYALGKSKNKCVRDCGTYLEPFAEGHYGTFNGQTNIDLSNNVVSFGFMQTSDEARDPTVFMATNLMWQKLLQNCDADMDTWMYFDEFQHQIKSPAAKSFFFEVYTRARKRRGIASAMTQSPESVLADAETRAVIKNCGMATLYYMLDVDVRTVGDLFSISEDQLDQIRRGQPGQGLYVFNKRAIAFDNTFEADSLIYRRFETSHLD